MNTKKTIEVRVLVHPGARKERLEVQKEREAFEIWVKEPAQKQLATRRVQALLANHFSVPLGAVRLKSGAQSRRKRFEVMLY